MSTHQSERRGSNVESTSREQFITIQRVKRFSGTGKTLPLILPVTTGKILLGWLYFVQDRRSTRFEKGLRERLTNPVDRLWDWKKEVP